MPNSRFRPLQLNLLVDDRGWDQIAPPVPAGGGSSTCNYQAQWRSIVAAAREVGWSPADVTERGTEALAEALRSSGLRSWAPATVTRYAKLTRLAGVDPRPHPQPVVTPLGEVRIDRLVRDSPHPVTQRNSVAALLTWWWPVELGQLLGLEVDRISSGRDGSVRVETDHGLVRVPRGAEVWDRWVESRRRWESSLWALCTAATSKTGQPPGGRLSARGFQAGFAGHCAAAGSVGLSWKRLRAVALRRDGADLTGVGVGEMV